MKDEFLFLRKKLIEHDFAHLNDMQREAVYSTEGALLILAGAGSGKTTVLINRAANLIKYGRAYFSDEIPPFITDNDMKFLREMLAVAPDEISEEESRRISNLCAVDPCEPWRILAITFTNKAAGELRERLSRMLGEKVGRDVMASTFHSFCARVLRTEADRLGYPKSFTIYDTQDSQRLMKECLRSLNINEKTLGHRAVLSEIGRAKDALLTPALYEEQTYNDIRKKQISQCYRLYQKKLFDSGAMDFDDLIFQTVLLFKSHPDVLLKYQRRYRYMMVDEYQDTNYSQYQLVSMLAAGSGNLCVVGDDDQSIYKFRGATIENILNFEKEFDRCKVVRLEQNYRSTKNILAASNSVISKNLNRKSKTLWTENDEGEPLFLHTLDNEDEEGRFIADIVGDGLCGGKNYSDFAVLYRMNAQSNAIERALVKSGIPYRIIGGHRFYDRLEVKDAIAYLRVIDNQNDEVSLRRIINNPKRGIGDTTVNRASDIAAGLGISLYEVLDEVYNYPDISRAAARISEFMKMMKNFKEFSEEPESTLVELYQKVLDESGYLEMWKAHGEDEESRVENLIELESSIIAYENNTPFDEVSLSGFLEEISLMTDLDNYDASADTVVMMTMHAAKGLEFPVVFLPGFEDGIFPGMQSMFNPDELEEDRRLCYVAFTRAKEKLYISSSESRMLYGSTTRNRPSRFLLDVPSGLIEVKENPNSIYRSSSFYTNSSVDIFSENDFGFSGGSISARSEGLDGGYKKTVGFKESKPEPETRWDVGEKVRHKIFGVGEIIGVTPMGNDILLNIKFEKETKKLMANFARLVREE